MSLTTTTLSAAIAVGDTYFTPASTTGFAAGDYVLIDQEFLQVPASYVAGVTPIGPCRRGVAGTAAQAHVKTANVTVGLPSDFANPAPQAVVGDPIAGKAVTLISYSTSGAIALPTAGANAVAVINGTSALAMTVAAPTKDMDGSKLTVLCNGAAAHTIQFTGGLSGAGTSYDVITVNATAPIAVEAYACNGLWLSPVNVPMAGTVTNITGTIG